MMRNHSRLNWAFRFVKWKRYIWNSSSMKSSMSISKSFFVDIFFQNQKNKSMTMKLSSTCHFFHVFDSSIFFIINFFWFTDNDDFKLNNVWRRAYTLCLSLSTIDRFASRNHVTYWKSIFNDVSRIRYV